MSATGTKTIVSIKADQLAPDWMSPSSLQTVSSSRPIVLRAAAAERFLRVQRGERNELEDVEQRLDQILTRLDAIERKRD